MINNTFQMDAHSLAERVLENLDNLTNLTELVKGVEGYEIGKENGKKIISFLAKLEKKTRLGKRESIEDK